MTTDDQHLEQTARRVLTAEASCDDLGMITPQDACIPLSANTSHVTAAPDTLAAKAVAMIHRAKIGALFVCKGKRPVGILHLHDLLRIGVV